MLSSEFRACARRIIGGASTTQVVPKVGFHLPEGRTKAALHGDQSPVLARRGGSTAPEPSDLTELGAALLNCAAWLRVAPGASWPPSGAWPDAAQCVAEEDLPTDPAEPLCRPSHVAISRSHTVYQTGRTHAKRLVVCQRGQLRAVRQPGHLGAQLPNADAAVPLCTVCNRRLSVRRSSTKILIAIQ